MHCSHSTESPSSTHSHLAAAWTNSFWLHSSTEGISNEWKQMQEGPYWALHQTLCLPTGQLCWQRKSPQHSRGTAWSNIMLMSQVWIIITLSRYKHVEIQTEGSSWHYLLLFCCHCLTLQQLTPSAFPAWPTVPSPPPLPKAAFPFLKPWSLCRKGRKRGSQITNWTQSVQKHSFLQHQQPLFSHLVPWEQRSASGKKVPAQFEQGNICSAWLLEQLLYITDLYWWLCCQFSVQSKVHFICSWSWGPIGNDCTWWADEYTTRTETTFNDTEHLALSKPDSQLWSKFNPL